MLYPRRTWKQTAFSSQGGSSSLWKTYEPSDCVSSTLTDLIFLPVPGAQWIYFYPHFTDIPPEAWRLKSLAQVTQLSNGENSWNRSWHSRNKGPEGQMLRLCLGKHLCPREVGARVGERWYKGIVEGMELRDTEVSQD